jgi:hypothetical protein
MNLRVTVGERKAARAIVIAGGNISPIMYVREVTDKKTVVDAVGIFIQENVAVTGRMNGPQLAIYDLRSRWACVVHGRVPAFIRVLTGIHPTVHGITPNCWQALQRWLYTNNVTGTFIDGQIIDVRKD